MKKLRHIVDKKVVKNTKFIILKTKVNKVDKQVPNLTTLIDTNQYNTDKQNLQKKTGGIDKKSQTLVDYLLQLLFTQKINECNNKIPNVSWFSKKADYDAKKYQISKENILLLLTRIN